MSFSGSTTVGLSFWDFLSTLACLFTLGASGEAADSTIDEGSVGFFKAVEVLSWLFV